VNRADLVSGATGLSMSPQTMFGGSIEASLLVFDGLGRWARAEGADAEVLASNFRHNATLDEIVLRVKESFFGLLAAEAIVAAAKETRDQSTFLLDMAKARHENGLVSKSDVLWAKTNLAKAEFLLTRAGNAHLLARGSLAVAMGLSVTAPVRIEKAANEIPEGGLGKIDELLEIASRRRPELQAALAVVRKRRASLKEAKASWWPVVSVEGSYGTRDDLFIPKQEEWSLGIGVNLPLFSGFRTSYGVRSARAGLAEAEAGFETLLRRFEHDVWTSFHEVETALGSIRASKALVDSATESVRAAEGQYKNGAGSMPDLITAQADETAARTALIRTTLDWRLSVARLERAVGVGESRRSESE
jgi:outer membrane protein TolC